LRAGLRGSREEEALEVFLEAFEPLPVDAQIARLGGDLRRRYGPSHNTGLADALIAATALTHGIPIVAFNVKHFPMLENVLRPYQRSM
jgi:predicted nucleic acid-binding protein